MKKPKPLGRPKAGGRAEQTTRIAQTSCPHCGKRLTGVDGPGAPGPGDITLCGECGELACFNPDLTMRKLTEAELIDVQRSLAWPRIVEKRKTLSLINAIISSAPPNTKFEGLVDRSKDPAAPLSPMDRFLGRRVVKAYQTSDHGLFLRFDADTYLMVNAVARGPKGIILTISAGETTGATWDDIDAHPQSPQVESVTGRRLTELDGNALVFDGEYLALFSIDGIEWGRLKERPN